MPLPTQGQHSQPDMYPDVYRGGHPVQQQPSQPFYGAQTSQWPSTSQGPTNSVPPAQTPYSSQQYSSQPVSSAWNPQLSPNHSFHAIHQTHVGAGDPNTHSYNGSFLDGTQQDWPHPSPLFGEQDGTIDRQYRHHSEQSFQTSTPIYGQFPGNQTGYTGQYPYGYETTTAASDGPVSPIQYKTSMAFNQAAESQQEHRELHSAGLIPVVNEIVESHAHSPSKSTSQMSAATTPGITRSVTGASALGHGGPSDWEHFGPSAGEQVDDTSPHQLDVAELPTHPSPPTVTRHRSESSAISLASEDDWPPPSAPAPLNIRRPVSRLELNDSLHREPCHSFTALDTDVQHQNILGVVSREVSFVDSRTAHATPRVEISDREQSHDTNRQRWLLEQPYQQQSESVQTFSVHDASPKPSTTGQMVTSPSPTTTFIIDGRDWMPPNDASVRRDKLSTQRSSPTMQTLEDRDAISLHAAGNSAVYCNDWIPTESPHVSQSSPSYLAPSVSKKADEQGEPIHTQASNSGGGLVPPSASNARKNVQGRPVEDEGRSKAPTALQKLGSGAVGDNEDWVLPADRAVERATTTARSAAAQEPEHPLQSPMVATGLDPWYASSLKRYADMLRQESGAATVDEKIKIFTAFVTEELKHRGIHTDGICGPSENLLNDDATMAAERDEESRVTHPSSTASAHRLKLSSPVVSEPYTMGTRADDEEYSPGGRPVLPRVTSELRDMQITSPKSAGSPSKGLVIGSVQAAMPGPEDAPILTEGPSIPAYKPYRHSVAVSGSEPSTHSAILTPASSTGDEHSKSSAPEDDRVEQLAYTPYSPHEHRGSVAALSQRRATLSTPTLPGPTTHEHQETSFDNPSPANPESPLPPAFPEPIPHCQNPLQALQTLLPSPSRTTATPHPSLTALTTRTAALASDHTWLSTLTSTWAAQAAATRQRLNAARRQRQSDAEALHDDLFNAHEINYADLGVLEAELQEQEGQSKEEEDRAELRSYVDEVFEAVRARLRGEIEELARAEEGMREWLVRAAMGRKALCANSSASGAPDLLGVLREMVGLHRKLEERHDMLVQAAAERDRRAKRTELQALYARGDIVRMKETERGFERGEKEAAVRAARDKTERAAKLLGAVQAAAARGLAANQNFVDEVVAAVEGLRGWKGTATGAGEAAAGDGGEAGVMQTLRRAKEALKSVAQASMELETLLHGMEVELNKAEFAVSVASARLEGMDRTRMKELDEKRKQGEAKMDTEFESRIAAARHDMGEAEALIDELLRGGVHSVQT